MNQAALAPRRRWPLVLPSAVLLVLAAVWSGLWYYAAQASERTIAAWIAHEAQHGRHYACASRTIGGYPFRFELRCANPRAEWRSAAAPLVFTAAELRAVAQIYQPNHVIAEIVGPVSIVEGERPVARAQWRLAQASLRAMPRAPERVSVVLDDARVDLSGASGADTVLAASRAEFHVRLDPDSERGNPVLDFAARIAGATAPGGGEFGEIPLDAELTAVLRGLKDFSLRSVPARLREWQETGGRLEVTSMRVKQGQAVAVAQGDVGLSGSGRLDGAINITMAGFEQIVQAVVSAATGMKVRGGMMAGLSMLGRPAELDGQRAVTLPLRFKDGAVSLGPVPLGKTPPLY